MPTLADITNDSIYQENKGTLSSRIDFAWSVFINRKELMADREKAMKFLIYAFDLKSTKNINVQLIQLMEKKNKYRNINSEYIPTKEPSMLPLNPSERDLLQITATNPPQNLKISDAILSKELLDVGSRYKNTFDPVNADYLDKEERAKHRVNIRNGSFVKDGRNFDTSLMSAKKESGIAAYTLNANGELSIFSHSSDRIFHSSMNAGAPVIAAGEIMIKDGALIKITTGSGHYQPSLFNVYRALEYFSLHGIDIDQAKVITLTKPALPNIETKSIVQTGRPQFETPANQIYFSLKKILANNVNSIQMDILNYKQADGVIDSIYEYKDKVIGSTLTQERYDLAMFLKQELEDFNESLTNCLSTTDLKMKIVELESIMNRYEDKNQKLSVLYDKEPDKGRLAEIFSNSKMQIAEIKAKGQVNEKPDVVSQMKKTS